MELSTPLVINYEMLIIKIQFSLLFVVVWNYFTVVQWWWWFFVLFCISFYITTTRESQMFLCTQTSLNHLSIIYTFVENKIRSKSKNFCSEKKWNKN